MPAQYLNQNRALSGHLCKGDLTVLRIQIHAAATLFHHLNVIPQLQRIQNAIFHAVVRRQAQHHQMGNAALTQPAVKLGFTAMTIVKKGAIAVDILIFAFMEGRIKQGTIQAGMEVRARRTLNAVIGPPDLRQTI